MGAGGRRRQPLSQGLDREVYQVVKRIIDDRSRFEDGFRPNFATIYDEIKRSNSSLNRKPKKLLEDSIERVLETIQQDAQSSDSEAQLNEQQSPRQKSASDRLNRSIVGMWATASGTSTPKSEEPPKITEKATMADSSEPISKRRLTNGEPLQKKRKATTNSIDKSPPTHVSLADLGGIEDVIQQMMDLLVQPLEEPEQYIDMGLQPPRGVLIHGPQGCGKTMLANAFAGHLGVNFISVSAPSIVSGMSGESEKALRDLFDEAKRSAPCLIFIDEIDAVTPKRDTAQREMEKRIVAQLLTCMDDLALERNDGKPVIVLAATNRPDSLDPALRRGGRFDKEINMSVPSEPVRERILRAITRKMKLSDDVDFSVLARRTPGFVGADLNSLVSTAGTAAMKRRQDMLRAASETASMDIDSEETTSTTPPIIRDLDRLLTYIRNNRDRPKSNESITYQDFLTALPKIQPSALREGFATIPTTTFASIGALQNHIAELTETIISPILDPSIYTDLGITPSSGALLWGPPGCGKTLLAKACANSSHANFISVKGPELLNKYVGESERAVRQVFTRARSSVPCIIFFDELDALVPRRDGTMSEASARVVNTLLTELDGVGNSREGIYVIAATNRPDIIDPAMLRPGRLETLLFVGLPDAEGRVDILRTLCKKLHNFAFDESVAAIARSCDGFSGADLESLLRRAGYAAIRRCSSALSGVGSAGVSITAEDFGFARTEVRRSVNVDDMKRYEHLQKQWGKS